MKKSLIISIITAAFCTASVKTLNAQSKTRGNSGPIAPVRIGSVTLNLGVGIGSEYKGDYYNSPFGIKGAVEWGLWHGGPGTITLGIETGASFSNGGYYDDYRSRTAIVAMRSAWHYGWKVRGLDTYGGFSAGMGFHHYGYHHNDDFNENTVIPVFGGFVGASYFVAPRFGFNAEAGYDITNFQAGVIFKLK
ncbi:MAG: hypothetical protein ABIR15_12020 [Chitinophagaceae bacterium]